MLLIVHVWARNRVLSLLLIDKNRLYLYTIREVEMVRDNSIVNIDRLNRILMMKPMREKHDVQKDESMFD